MWQKKAHTDKSMQWLYLCGRRVQVKPGLLWSYLRDTGSIGTLCCHYHNLPLWRSLMLHMWGSGGAIVLGPQLSAVVNTAIGNDGEPAGPVLRFFSGVVTGSMTGEGSLYEEALYDSTLTSTNDIHCTRVGNTIVSQCSPHRRPNG